MSLQESGEMYLETVYILSKTMPIVRSIDVCEHMGFSKPSVSRAVGLLKAGGYLNVDSKGSLTLTKTGAKLGKKIYERHTLLTKFLTGLGVNKQTALEDACKIEHHISDESFEAIKNFTKK